MGMILESLNVRESSYVLLRAVEADIPAIVELMQNDAIRKADFDVDHESSARYLKAFRAIDADPAHLLVVAVDDARRVVGTMQLTVLPGLARAGATRLQIEAVRVDETLRGNGLGSTMINWAIAEGKRRGVKLVQLTSDASRKDAHRFYERLGFTASHVGFKLRITGE